MAANEPGGAEKREKLVKDGLPGKVRRTLGKVGFVEAAVAAFYCAFDPATPKRVKAILIAALAYFIVPADLIPDIFALIGYTDDAAVFWAAWRAVSNHITEEHKRQARTYLSDH